MDYVLISYYEDDCNDYQPQWQEVFDSLHVLFPNSKIGIGECGTTNAGQKAAYAKRYYSMNITTPNYIGGYFWWYYKQDCVPYTKPLWKTIDSLMCPSSVTSVHEWNAQTNNLISFSNYPNPFIHSTNITFDIVQATNLKITVVDILGRELEVITEKEFLSGAHTVAWQSNHESGVYYLKISDYQTTTTLPILITGKE